MHGTMRKTMKGTLPSLFTVGNLLCGYLAVINVIEGALVHAAWWIIIAAFFDHFDGKVARMTATASRFGIEFDSITDMVSFGIAPAVLFHQFMLIDAGNLGYFLAFLFVFAGAFRLARFNISAGTVMKEYFTGMPIPAGAGVLASYVLFCENVWSDLAQFDLAVAIIVLTSAAMVSLFRYSAMPRISFDNVGESLRSAGFIALLGSVILYPDEVFFPLGLTYLFSGPVRTVTVPAYHFVTHRTHGR
ncbi:CDP-diacylglycerol--serine O-phosphatidyltransferase [Candidatus Latescibacterota bacterium]